MNIGIRERGVAPKSHKRATGEARRPSRCDTARAYDHVGNAYGAYADCEALSDPLSCASRFAHADSVVWETIRREIDDLRSAGVRTLRVLDAGCGPGTWLRRVARYASRLGLELDATGFDIAEGQLEIARRHLDSINAGCRHTNTTIRFLNHNLADELPWANGQFHIVLCNYVVLNHLERRALPRAISELCRVATHRVIATLRAVASPATGCIIGPEAVSEYHHDCARGELTLRLKDGTEQVVTLNLYTAEILKGLFSTHATIKDIRAVDLFLSRFASDENWTAELVGALPGREQVIGALKDAEAKLCRKPAWLDHGTHILVMAQPGGGSRKRAER